MDGQSEESGFHRGKRYHGRRRRALTLCENEPQARRSELVENTLAIEVRGVQMTHYVGNSRLRVWAENMERIEPEILDWIDGFEPDSVFFDLGASTGLFSIYAAVKA